MRRHRRLLLSLLFLVLSAATAQPAPAASGPADAVNRYLAALRANDRAALAAVFAPDYRYDGLDRTAATDVFDSFLGLRYRFLHAKIESLVRTGDVVTATAGFIFQAVVNLAAVEGGQPVVNGSGRLVLELSRRGSEWLITGGRVVRGSYAAPGRSTAYLFDVTVNGATSVRVAPGATLTVAGKVFGAELLFISIGASSRSAAVDPETGAVWQAPLAAPDTPGRYLFHAIAVSRDLQVLERVTLPVIVAVP